MPADFLPRAAGRFTRASTSRTGGGSGLGLALVAAIAHAHGGQLRVCADGNHHRQPSATGGLERLACDHVDEGTTVTLLLPAEV